MRFTSYPCANNKDTGYISIEDVSFPTQNNDQNETTALSTPKHKLILRQIELGEEYHISLLFHYYRIFYKTAQALSESAENAIVNMINRHISNNDSTVPSYTDACENKLFSDDILNEPGFKDILTSMGFVSQRHQIGHSIIFALYLEPITLNDDNNTPKLNHSARHNIITPYGLPIAFTLIYPQFSSIYTSTHFLINDLYVDSIYRHFKCGTRLLQYVIQYTKTMLKPLSPFSDKLILSICTGLDNKAGQRLYPYMGFKEVERSERNQCYEYHMEI